MNGEYMAILRYVPMVYIVTWPFGILICWFGAQETLLSLLLLSSSMLSISWLKRLRKPFFDEYEFKRTPIKWNRKLWNTINVTFDQFNASLLTKNINFSHSLKKKNTNHTNPKLLNSSVFFTKIGEMPSETSANDT